MDFRDLQLLVTAAKAKGFSGTARVLGLDTSTVSRRIARLEDRLGLALLERGHAGVRLTRGGTAVVQQAVRALEALASIEQVGSQSGTGEIGEIRLGICIPQSQDRFTTS